MKKSCHYCLNYQESNERRVRYEKKGKETIAIHSRRCLISEVFVEENDGACEDFKLGQKFFCQKLQRWYDIKICLSRQKKTGKYSSRWPEAFEDCPCGRQAKLVVELVKENAMKNKVKPVLKLRSKKNDAG
jgi:hypothetical protein